MAATFEKDRTSMAYLEGFSGYGVFSLKGNSSQFSSCRDKLKNICNFKDDIPSGEITAEKKKKKLPKINVAMFGKNQTA